jgi:hypothetical protein
MGKYGPSGGSGGDPNPGFFMSVSEEVGEVVVHVGHRDAAAFIIVAIEFVSRQGQIQRFGGNGDADYHSSFSLDTGDAIDKITGRSGAYVNTIRIWLKSGRDSGWLGGSVFSREQLEFEYDGGNQRIVGLWGRTGAWIDAIGVYSA